MTKTALLLAFSWSAMAAGPEGEWYFRLIRFGEPFAPARIQLESQGEKVTGTLNELKLAGSLKGDRITLTGTRPNGKEWGKLDGQLQGDTMSGTIKQQDDQFEWAASRLPASTAAPKTHDFVPDKFHRAFSGAIPPALHIQPGDTVTTTTVDAGGRDAKNVRRSLGGNPETGPFYIDGAVPGDTLAVRLNRVRLNRDSATSGDAIVSSALEPYYFRNAKFKDDFNSEWKLDLKTGTATLAKPTDRMKNFQVKLQPMLGCIGVAPASNQAFRSGWLGPWGGNMDYSGVKEGVTVYLPVFQEGALLFVGDGHALEGDGELNGDALETSLDLQFTVNLVKGKSTRAPRFESDEFLMASGIGGSLQESLQQATTELARWLERDYNLSANESNIVLGTSIRYDIAEVVDPQFHIVAKVAKSVLAPLKQ